MYIRQKENKMKKLNNKNINSNYTIKIQKKYFVCIISIIDEYKGYLIKWKYTKYDKNVYSFLHWSDRQFPD